MSVKSLEKAFRGLADALATGDLDRFYGVMLPDVMIMDEDLPFRVDRTGFQDHISFHLSGIWEGFAWKPDRVSFSAQGDSGAVAGFSMFRGKPRDAGFRLRPMLFTQGWTRNDGVWRLASWQQSPIVGHVQQQSPA
jgi:ketosteroid isomerase-like protein